VVYHIAMTSKPAPAEPSDPFANVLHAPVALVGAGVVGRAILADCVSHGLPVLLADTDPASLRLAAESVLAPALRLTVRPIGCPLPGLNAIAIHGSGPVAAEGWERPAVVIESIPEQLELKRAFFLHAAAAWGPETVLATNTSNLKVAEIFAPLGDPTKALGMHFFMPVTERPLIEMIPCDSTSPETLRRCREFAASLSKEVLVTKDSPGFVVNRLLAPYLNQAMLLLGRGASAADLDRAAREFGMPMSPLELVDRIGMRTAFDTGRVFWRAFPKRIDPAPILPGMLKAKRLGAAAGGGFFHGLSAAETALVTDRVHPDAQEVIRRYTRETRAWEPEQLRQSLAIPMWIEAAELLADRVVDSLDRIELAMRGGLGFRGGFFRFFDSLGSPVLEQAIRAGQGEPALMAPNGLLDLLAAGRPPSETVRSYADLG
jgi:3-hydroxyacyl-CoA dehydrogenase/enoyl-CoA hydratase/3-hydroxybutyryl-CoA epimerase/enoyl-CoA isomerase